MLLLLIFTTLISTYAWPQAVPPTSDSLIEVYVDKKDLRHCPTGMIYSKKDWFNLEERVLSMSFSPKCIWDTIRWDAFDHSGEVAGFAFGSIIGVGAVGSSSAGTELLVLEYDSSRLMVAQVRYRTLSTEISLPMGVGLSQSVIFGQCPNKAESYLGWFDSVLLGAKAANFGRKKMNLFNRMNDLTGCNSLSSIRGLNTPLVGVSVSFYELLGRPILIYGPGAQDMIDYLESTNFR